MGAHHLPSPGSGPISWGWQDPGYAQTLPQVLWAGLPALVPRRAQPFRGQGLNCSCEEQAREKALLGHFQLWHSLTCAGLKPGAAPASQSCTNPGAFALFLPCRAVRVTSLQRGSSTALAPAELPGESPARRENTEYL